MTSTHLAVDYSPREWQRNCHHALKRFNVFVLHRRAGKTELAIMELLDKAMRFNKELGFFVFCAPYLKQAKAIAWTRIKSKLKPMIGTGAVTINESELSVTFGHNNAVIRIFGADNGEAMRGVRLDGCVLDEFAIFKPGVWEDIIQPTLSDRNGWAIFIGTPNGVNAFSELFYKAQKLPDWHSAIYTVYDTDAVIASEVERLRRDMTETSFSREYLCDFNASAEDQLISLSDANTAANREYADKDFESAPKIVGVDPARFGDDRSVIIRRQGLKASDIMVFRGLDNMQLAARVAMVMDLWEPDAVFIDAGGGAGVLDRLRQLDYDPIEVHFGGKANLEQQFVNRRTEMWWNMKEWIENGGAIPSDPMLRQELSTPTYWFDAQGRKMLESKDEIKKRLQGGASPDIADALALTFAYPVGKRLPLEVRNKLRLGKASDYDPYSRND
jgi:hypothetical protein